jgi:23S rRNA C2498 (ribose-2'-O)-methylase RlmM
MKDKMTVALNHTLKSDKQVTEYNHASAIQRRHVFVLEDVAAFAGRSRKSGKKYWEQSPR